MRFSEHKCFIVFVSRSLLWEFLVMRPLASLLDVLGITENLQTLWSWLPELSPLFRFQHCFYWHCLYSRWWIAEENGESWGGQITYPFERYRDSTLEWNLCFVFIIKEHANWNQLAICFSISPLVTQSYIHVCI